MWTGRAAGDASFRSVHFFWPEAGASPPPWGRGGRHVASQDCALVSFLPAFGAQFAQARHWVWSPLLFCVQDPESLICLIITILFFTTVIL